MSSTAPQTFLSVPHSPASREAPRTSATELLAATAILLLLLLISRGINPLALSSGYLGGSEGDAGLYVWLFNHHLTHLFSSANAAASWFETTAFYPYGQTLAWSDNFILPALLAAPFHAAGLSAPLLYNLIQLLALLLGGTLTYLLARRLHAAPTSALITASIFLLFPFLAAHAGHPQLQFILVFPLIGLGLLSAGRERPLLGGFTAGVALTIGFYTAVYYAVFGALLIGASAVLYLLLNREARALRPLLLFVAGVLLATLPIIPSIPAYLTTREIFGERNLYEMFYFAASGLSLFAPPQQILLTPALSELSHPEAANYPGIIALITLAATLLTFRQRVRSPWYLGLLGCLGVAVLASAAATLFEGRIEEPLRLIASLAQWGALGSFVIVICTDSLPNNTNERLTFGLIGVTLYLLFLSWGPLSHPQHGFGAISLHAASYAVLPGLEATRAIGRLGIVISFLLAILFALRFPKLSRSYTAALIVILLLDLAVRGSTPIAPAPRASPLLLSAAPQLASDEAIMILPWAVQFTKNREPARWSELATLQTRAMNETLEAGIRTVNGYSGQLTKLMRELPWRTRSFPDAASLRSICSVPGVRLIYTRGESLPLSKINERLAARPATANTSTVTLLSSDQSGDALFRVSCREKLPFSLTLSAQGLSNGVAIPAALQVENISAVAQDLSVSLASKSETPVGESTRLAPGVSVLPIPRAAGESSARPLWVVLSGGSEVRFVGLQSASVATAGSSSR